METVFCPTYSNTAEIIVENGKDFFLGINPKKIFQVGWCDSCLVGFSLPEMSHQELSQYYPEEFEAYQPKAGFFQVIQGIKYRQDLQIIKKLTQGLKYTPTVFEIGAGRGEFLSILKSNGFSVCGIEPGEAGRGFAKRQFGIELLNGNGDQIEFFQKYDVIIMRHVLEHLNQPTQCLKNIFSNGLKTGGVLVLKIPSLDSLEYQIFGKYWHGLDLPRHRFHFTPKGLSKTLTEIGFSKVEVSPERIGSSLMRSIRYCSENDSRWWRLPATLFCWLPKAFQILICQLIVSIFFFFKADRMIITAQRSNEKE